MSAINVYVVERASGLIKSQFICNQWEIITDYLTNEQSAFTTSIKHGASMGDYVIAKDINEIEIINNGIKPLYVGIVESIEDETINTTDIYNIANFEIFVNYYGNSNALFMFYVLLNRYILEDNSKVSNLLTITPTDPSEGVECPFYYLEDNSKSEKLIDLLIEQFKGYRMAWTFRDITAEDNKIKINTDLKISDKSINIKNNVYSFVNWSVYVKENKEDNPNGLLIYDKDNTQPFSGTVMYAKPLVKYYQTIDGKIQQDSLNNVKLPTYDKVYLYDNTAEDKPTYREVAQQELGGNSYSHEITFDIQKNNKILDYKDLEVGAIANIVYNGDVYESVLTGYTLSSDSDFITLKFGNYRSNFTQVFLNQKNK